MTYFNRLINKVHDFPDVAKLGIIAWPKKRHDHQRDVGIDRIRKSFYQWDAVVLRDIHSGKIFGNLNLLDAVIASLDSDKLSLFGLRLHDATSTRVREGTEKFVLLISKLQYRRVVDVLEVFDIGLTRHR